MNIPSMGGPGAQSEDKLTINSAISGGGTNRDSKNILGLGKGLSSTANMMPAVEEDRHDSKLSNPGQARGTDPSKLSIAVKEELRLNQNATE
jgi:hypothetical protein